MSKESIDKNVAWELPAAMLSAIAWCVGYFFAAQSMSEAGVHTGAIVTGWLFGLLFASIIGPPAVSPLLHALFGKRKRPAGPDGDA